MYKIRGKIGEIDQVVDVVSYDIDKDVYEATNGETYKVNDFVYFIIPKDEYKKMLKVEGKSEGKIKNKKDKEIVEEVDLI